MGFEVSSSRVKFMLSEKASKIDKISTLDWTFTTYKVKCKVEISSIFVAFLEKMNFIQILSRFYLDKIKIKSG